jgi:hypothetical protein
MFHPSSKRTYYFAGTNPSEVERWAEFLLKASKAEALPKGTENRLGEDPSTSEYENG